MRTGEARASFIDYGVILKELGDEYGYVLRGFAPEFMADLEEGDRVEVVRQNGVFRVRLLEPVVVPERADTVENMIAAAKGRA
jgi:hypothetical protein